MLGPSLCSRKKSENPLPLAFHALKKHLQLKGRLETYLVEIYSMDWPSCELLDTHKSFIADTTIVLFLL